MKITATACSESEKNYEASGNPTEPIEEHRPICVEVDALPVCDDVGGIYGYCNMLKVLHGDDLEAIQRKRHLLLLDRLFRWCKVYTRCALQQSTDYC